MKRIYIISFVILLVLYGCGGGSDDGGGIVSQPSLYYIGGYVIGLDDGESLVIENGNDSLTLREDGIFRFPTEVANDGEYDVKIKEAPQSKLCRVNNGSGVVRDHDVTDIEIQCLNTYSVGGTVNGLDGSLILDNNGSRVTVTESGSFTFPDRYPGGTTYDIKVMESPPYQNCTVSEGEGMVTVRDIDNIDIECSYHEYTLGVNVTGLNGRLSVENGDDYLIIEEDGTYFFPTSVTYLYPYSVTVISWPYYQVCNVIDGDGVMTGDTAIDVECKNKEFFLGGTISNLNFGEVLIIADSLGEMITTNTGGDFHFIRKYEAGSDYEVSIVQQPAHQLCTISNASGVIFRDIDYVEIDCLPIQYTIGGRVNSIYEGELVLTNNGGGDLVITQPGTFTFSTTQIYDTTYDVSIKSYPRYQTCTITNYSGTVTSNVTDIEISCSYRYYSVSGTVENLPDGEVVFKNNLGDIIRANGDEPFTFPSLFRDGSSYYVTILTDPPDRDCVVRNGSGNIDGEDVTDVSIDCYKYLTLSGSVTGTEGNSFTFKEHGALVTVHSDGDFTFPVYYGPGDEYRVEVYAKPVSMNCFVSNGTGIFGSSNVTDVTVICKEGNGYLDPTFNASETPGYVTMFQSANPGSGNGDCAWDVVIDSRNRIVVTGWSDNGSDVDMLVWRFNEDGSIDHTFGQDHDGDTIPDGYDVFDAIAGYKQNDWGLGVTIDTNGKIVVTGYGKRDVGNDDMVLIRLNEDGSFDTTFNGTGVVTNNNAAGGNKHDRGRDVTFDKNGNIIVLGESYLYSTGGLTEVIWEYTPGGSLNTAFSYDGIWVAGGTSSDEYNMRGVAYSPSRDHIFTSGNYTNNGGASYTLFLAEVRNYSAYTADGLDRPSAYKGMKMTLDKSEDAIVTGQYNFSSMFVRYYGDTLDSMNTSFNGTGTLIYTNPYGGTSQGDDVAVDSYGRIIVVGYAYNGSKNDMVVWRFNPDGTPDESFGDNGVFRISGSGFGEGNDYAHGVAIDHNGRIVVVGESHNSDDTQGKMVIWRIVP